MILWIVLTTMTAIVALWAALPFLHRSGERGSATQVGKSSAVYRDQLRQIDAELKAGVINDAEAQATRTEVARRLVLAERDENAVAERREIGNPHSAAVGIACAIALGSTILYAKLGEPELIPTVRYAGEGGDANSGALPSRHPPVSSRARPSSGAEGNEQGAGLPSIDGMIERLALRLKANPEDPAGWRTLGWSYASQGRLDEAAAAYDEAIKRQPENGDLYGARGEILVRSSNGLVTPEAASAFEEALARDKENPRARFFLGLRKEQAGNRVGALNDWISMLQGAPPNETWVKDLRARVEQVAAELKVDLTGRLPAKGAPQQAAGGGPVPGIPGVLPGEGRPGSQAAVGSARKADQREAALSPEDQSNMIRGMVEGLAARLEKQPRDFEGWSRLIRSRAVMGESDKAKTALAKAREIFADKPEALSAFGLTARELGLEP